MKHASKRIVADSTHDPLAYEQRLVALPRTTRHRFHDGEGDEAASESPTTGRCRTFDRDVEDES